MPQDPRLDELVRLVYEAAADRSQWPAFFSKYTGIMNAPSAVFLIHDPEQLQANVSANAGVDPAWVRPYEAYYAARNEWLGRGGHLFQPGAVILGEACVGDRDLTRSEFYHDFLRPQDWFYCCGGTATRNRSGISYISVLRSKNAGSFTAEELAIFEHVMPHLQCAVRVHQRIAGLESDLRTASGALDRFPTGVAVVDSNARVLFLNRSAELMLERQDGLAVTADGLRAAGREDERRLRNAIAAISSKRGGEIQRPGTVSTISRPSGRRPFELLVAPLPSQSTMSKGKPAAMLLITDPDDDAALDGQTLRDRFGLTPAEARMAQALARGKSVEEYAREASIGMNTARTHAKRIYWKTGVRRQTELVRLMLSGTAKIGQYA